MIRTEQIDAGRVKGLATHAEKPRAGVLLLCTITGVDAFMRERGQRLAEAGYSSLVWDPYPGEPLPQDLSSAQTQAKKLNDGAVDEMADCVSYMLATMKLPAAAVVVDTDLDICLARQHDRPGSAPGRRWGRAVPASVVRNQHARTRASLAALPGEGVTAVVHLHSGHQAVSAVAGG